MQIKIIDDLPPEACAMAQALYSRSPKSIDDHLLKIKETGADKFMGTYYVGYGHKSIGDCGTTSIFIEGVSMLAAKAIQEWQLYNGQEASTRYMDFGNQEGPWFEFYRTHLPRVQEFLSEKYPGLIDKGIKARAFDIMRAFLPAGAKTNLSWHTNLRQAADHIMLLRYHPLEEVREITKGLWLQLSAKYPSSFSFKTSVEQEKYRFNIVKESTYLAFSEVPSEGRFFPSWSGEELEPMAPVFNDRPKYTELPFCLETLGFFRFRFSMDYGSYRDLARHRNGVVRVTELTQRLGFEQWYLDHLPVEVATAATRKLKEFRAKDQYDIPMGYKVGVHCTLPLNAAVYLAELRTGMSVHPTLRIIAQKMAAFIKQRHGITLHANMEQDDPLKIFELRAKHDITEKRVTEK